MYQVRSLDFFSRSGHPGQSHEGKCETEELGALEVGSGCNESSGSEPPFGLTGSSRMRSSAMCLSRAKAWAAALVRVRIRSSLKDTSIDRCRRFSIDQWERTAWAMPVGIGSQTTDAEALFVVLSPRVRSDASTAKQRSPLHWRGLSRHCNLSNT